MKALIAWTTGLELRPHAGDFGGFHRRGAEFIQ